MSRRLVFGLIAACFLLAPGSVTASPWTLDEDEIIVTGRFDFQYADQEYFESGTPLDYSLNGRHRAATFDLSTRLGLIDGLELTFEMPLKLVSYRSDPVILLPCEEQSLDCSQENVISLSKTTGGVGDIRLGTRYQFLEGSIAGAFELELKTPTGYDRPAGTFGNEPKSAADFQENITTYVQPENVEDDVTLGDGQVDLSALALLGWSFSTRTFLRLDSGYILRFGGAGDQVLTHLQVGQSVGNWVMLVGGSRFAYSVQEGEVIGVSVAAEDPSLPAEDYGGTKNLKLREVPLSQNSLKMHAGILLRATSQVELKLSYSQTVWGRNTALTQTVSLGFGTKFNLPPEESS